MCPKNYTSVFQPLWIKLKETVNFQIFDLERDRQRHWQFGWILIIGKLLLSSVDQSVALLVRFEFWIFKLVHRETKTKTKIAWIDFSIACALKYKYIMQSAFTQLKQKDIPLVFTQLTKDEVQYNILLYICNWSEKRIIKYDFTLKQSKEQKHMYSITCIIHVYIIYYIYIYYIYICIYIYICVCVCVYR